MCDLNWCTVCDKAIACESVSLFFALIANKFYFILIKCIGFALLFKRMFFKGRWKSYQPQQFSVFTRSQNTLQILCFRKTRKQSST